MSLAASTSDISLRIVSRPAFRLAGIKIRTDMQAAAKDVKKLWREVLPQIRELSADKNDAAYGISWVVDPDTRSFDYCAAFKTGRNSVLPEQFEETLIPAGLYAECALPSREALHRLYSYLYYEWLPSQKDQVDIGGTPCYEVYPQDYLQGGSLKMYIPVVAV